MVPKFASAHEAMNALDGFPEWVDHLTRSRDPGAISQLVKETEEALEVLKQHHSPAASPAREAGVGANGHRR